MKKLNNLKKLSGFTLLELLIALSIILLLWGSILHIHISIRKSFKELKAQSQKSEKRTQIFSHFEKDLNRMIKNLHGENSRITFETLDGEISYNFEGKELYRKENQKHEKIDDRRIEGSWAYYSKKQWLKTWNDPKPPQAILMTIQMDQDLFKMIFPIRNRE